MGGEDAKIEEQDGDFNDGITNDVENVVCVI